MTLAKARLVLFGIWLGLLLGYVVMFLLTSQKTGITVEQASESCWKAIYVILPILTAFGSFWFIPQVGQPRRPRGEERPVPFDRLVAMFAITGTTHVIVGLYFLFAVILPDFGYPDQPISYSGRVDMGVKLLVFLSSLAVLPVGYVLGRKVDAPKEPGTTGSDKAREPRT